MKFNSRAVKQQMIGFAITGFVSTGIMFGLYVGFHVFMNYQYAYLIAYSISVLALYFMNTLVFQQPISLQTFLEFPMIYLLQYALGAGSLEILVRFGFSETFAPLVVVVILWPITFLLNRIVFSKK